ncbi:S-phase kinase-associated protein 1-like isoform X2 [Chelonus insularis]|nr:S-phase kinase-associated protein 1-like isoform X2 [Chelonus insularis]
MTTIKLQTNDGEIFEVDTKIAKLSGTIKCLVEDLNPNDDQDDDREDEIIPLSEVNSTILRKVIEWATYHQDDPLPLEDNDIMVPKRSDDISEWDANFLKVDQKILFEIIAAANYLDVKGLMEVSCKTVANMIKGRSLAELRALFGEKKSE